MSDPEGRAAAYVTVVGSVNVDLTVKCPQLPAPGATVLAESLRSSPGGKGANQAVAAGRLGAHVGLVARVGDDAEAALALSILTEEGVDVSAVRTSAGERTGLALITVDSAGENTIVVHGGANRLLSGADLPTELSADVVVAQLEIGTDTVLEAARRTRGMFVLNAAPAAELPSELVQRSDVIVVNEIEYAALAPQLRSAPGVVVRTLGAHGAQMLEGERVVASAPAPRVAAIDTVGAGDTFVGALAVALATGMERAAALTWACAAGAFSTTRPGAQASMPSAVQVAALLASAQDGEVPAV